MIKIFILLLTPCISFGKILYENDKGLIEQGIQLYSFGSGKLTESTELNSKCLRLESNNLYSGGKIMFSHPIDINEIWSQRDLLLTIDFIQGGNGFFFNRKYSSSKGSRKKFDFKISFLQADHKGGEICFPLEVGTSQIGILLNSIKGLSPMQPLMGLKFSTSTEECLFITRVHFNKDATPIKGKILPIPKEVSLGEEIKFNAEGYGGSTPLHFDWAINPKSTFQIDGKGSQWSYRFMKPGTYYVQLTISDLFNLKKPYITSTKIIVNP